MSSKERKMCRVCGKRPGRAKGKRNGIVVYASRCRYCQRRGIGRILNPSERNNVVIAGKPSEPRKKEGFEMPDF